MFISAFFTVSHENRHNGRGDEQKDGDEGARIVDGKDQGPEEEANDGTGDGTRRNPLGNWRRDRVICHDECAPRARACEHVVAEPTQAVDPRIEWSSVRCGGNEACHCARFHAMSCGLLGILAVQMRDVDNLRIAGRGVISGGLVGGGNLAKELTCRKLSGRTPQGTKAESFDSMVLRMQQLLLVLRMLEPLPVV